MLNFCFSAGVYNRNSKTFNIFVRVSHCHNTNAMITRLRKTDKLFPKFWICCIGLIVIKCYLH